MNQHSDITHNKKKNSRFVFTYTGLPLTGYIWLEKLGLCVENTLPICFQTCLGSVSRNIINKSSNSLGLLPLKSCVLTVTGHKQWHQVWMDNVILFSEDMMETNLSKLSTLTSLSLRCLVVRTTLIIQPCGR